VSDRIHLLSQIACQESVLASGKRSLSFPSMSEEICASAQTLKEILGLVQICGRSVRMDRTIAKPNPEKCLPKIELGNHIKPFGIGNDVARICARQMRNLFGCGINA
jgi:hypothetical protein